MPVSIPFRREQALCMCTRQRRDCVFVSIQHRFPRATWTLARYGLRYIIPTKNCGFNALPDRHYTIQPILMSMKPILKPHWILSYKHSRGSHDLSCIDRSEDVFANELRSMQLHSNVTLVNMFICVYYPSRFGS